LCPRKGPWVPQSEQDQHDIDSEAILPGHQVVARPWPRPYFRGAGPEGRAIRL
jgi:hypothetical protein